MPKVEDVINKALEKDRNLRYQHASEMRTDLQRLKRDTESARPAVLNPAAAPVAAAALTGVAPQTSSSSPVIAVTRQHKWGVAAVVRSVLILLVAAGLGLYFLRGERSRVFENFSVTQATNSGKATLAATSPDGKYVLSVLSDNGELSLWLRNVATNSDTQIIPPAPASYRGLAFSPDGNYIYFLKAENATETNFNLYRSPVLGGTPQLIVRDVDTRVTFSPDGQRMAYIRGNDPEMGKYRVLTASLDGSDERIVRIASFVEGSPIGNLAWSPDSKQLAHGVLRPKDGLGGIDLINLANGRVRPAATFSDRLVHELQWLPDGGGLLGIYSTKGPNFDHTQIGFISYPGAQLRAVTRDANRYETLTLSADGKTLATVQVRTKRDIYLVPAGVGKANNPNPAMAQEQSIRGFNWRKNGDILIAEGDKLVQASPDGGQRVTLLSDANAAISSVTACANGRYMLLEWDFRGGTNGTHIWRANADGSHPIQLTSGKRDRGPICSLDGKWVYYWQPWVAQIMRVPMSGGKSDVVPGSAVPSAGFSGNRFDLSPDGKLLAYPAATMNPETQSWKPQVALVSLGSGAEPSLRLLNAEQRISGGVKFTADGKAVAYPIREKGVDNLWVQPLDDSPGRQITNFKSEQISTFDRSPDGKTWGILRERTDSDVVLMQDTGSPSR
jgi:eukaryotic-like serine/threonine-protein kinase